MSTERKKISRNWGQVTIQMARSPYYHLLYISQDSWRPTLYGFQHPLIYWVIQHLPVCLVLIKCIALYSEMSQLICLLQALTLFQSSEKRFYEPQITYPGTFISLGSVCVWGQLERKPSVNIPHKYLYRHLIYPLCAIYLRNSTGITKLQTAPLAYKKHLNMTEVNIKWYWQILLDDVLDQFKKQGLWKCYLLQGVYLFTNWFWVHFSY